MEEKLCVKTEIVGVDLGAKMLPKRLSNIYPEIVLREKFRNS